MSSRLLCCTGSLDGGGSERQLWQLATHIDPVFFSPQIYLLTKRGIYLSRLPDELTVHAFRADPSPPAKHWLHIPGQIHRDQVAHLRALLLRQRIDVVFDRTFHMTLVTAPACRQARVPRVSVIVSPPSQDLGNSHERFRWLKRRFLARAYREPLAITVAVSKDVADDAAKFYGLQRDAIRVIENPIDIAAVQQQALCDGDTAKTCMKKNLGAMQVAIVGRLSHEKGQEVAIRALAEVKKQPSPQHIALHLIGDGPNRNQLQELAQSLGVRDDIHLHGFQDNPYPWMKNADLICIPSRYEGLPNVALEAMALGTPLLVTNCSSSLMELISVDQSRGAMVSVDDAVGMSQKFIECKVQKEAWNKRAKEAQAWVAEHYGIEQGVKRVEDVLQACMKLGEKRGSVR